MTAQPSGNLRPPILLDVKIKVYGLKVDGKDFATCSFAKIEAAHNDNVCPKKAMVATGYIHALLGDSTDFTKTGAACDPGLDVWNGGQGKVTYFFYTNNAYQCLGGALKTGATPPYAGTYKMVGKYFEIDTPDPERDQLPGPRTRRFAAVRAPRVQHADQGRPHLDGVGRLPEGQAPVRGHDDDDDAWSPKRFRRVKGSDPC